MSNLPDSSLSASNQLDSVARSRLHTTSGATGTLPGAWTADVITGEDIWIQADLVYEMTLEKVATQGHHDLDQWVTSFTLSMGSDRSSFSDLTNPSGTATVFNQNPTSRNIVIEHDFTPISARFVRLNVLDYNVQPSLRWEIYGCLTGLTIYNIPSSWFKKGLLIMPLLL